MWASTAQQAGSVYGFKRKVLQGSSEAHTQPGRSCHTPGEDNVPDNLAVNGARDAVLQLQVHLGHGVLREDGGIRDVTCELIVSEHDRAKRGVNKTYE